MPRRETKTKKSTGFAPIASRDARLLILGTLPSRRSLETGQYYAHPRNAFWRIMAAVYGVSGDYAARCRGLTEAGVAVWDVLQSAERPGSLDADIRPETATANDFAGFFAAHPRISRIGFNGRNAEALFRRRVLPGLDGVELAMTSLPSTSPAHAAMSFDKKLAVWRSMLVHAFDDRGTK